MRLIVALAIACVPAFGSDARAQAPAAKTVAKLPTDGSDLVARPWTGDFDGMVKRRMVRALVVSSRMFYYVDRGTQRGATYEALQLFEKYVNQQKKTGSLPVHVVCIPVRRDQLIPMLRDGRGDIAAANLGVTAGREEVVDFSDPIRADRDEIAVTGPASKALASVDDLAGREVYVRKSSSYYEHLEGLNARFKKEGKEAVRLRLAPEALQDDDLLEMLNAGLVGIVVVDSRVGQFWAKVFPKIVLHPGVVVDKGGRTAWMFREHSPQLKAAVDGFLRKYPEGSLERNMILQKYLKSTKWVRSATSAEELKKFQQTIALFQQYGTKYDMDYLLLMAQAYQESQLDQQAKSHVGAVGIMQVMPATGKDMGVGDIHQIEPNIHAGVKYIRYMIDRYYAKEPMDRLNKGLFAFASYNAGPARIQQLRQAATKRGLDRNVWFDNVEVIASERIGRETVQYVSNIYKYYVAYTLIVEDDEARRKAMAQLEKKAS